MSFSLVCETVLFLVKNVFVIFLKALHVGACWTLNVSHFVDSLHILEINVMYGNVITFWLCNIV
jgi:hypothetical protein